MPALFWQMSRQELCTCPFLSRRLDKGRQALQYTLTDDPAKKFCMQLRNRGERHLRYAWNHGEEIVTDGIQVSSLSPLF